jgi:hypothetical protein
MQQMKVKFMVLAVSPAAESSWLPGLADAPLMARYSYLIISLMDDFIDDPKGIHWGRSITARAVHTCCLESGASSWNHF